MLLQARSVMSYFGLIAWIAIIYFVIFKLKVFAYTYVNDISDGAH